MNIRVLFSESGWDGGGGGGAGVFHHYKYGFKHTCQERDFGNTVYDKKVMGMENSFSTIGVT